MPSQSGEEYDTPEHREDCITFALRAAQKLADQGDLDLTGPSTLGLVTIGACDHDVAAAIHIQAALRAWVDLGGMPITFIRELIADRRAASLE